MPFLNLFKKSIKQIADITAENVEDRMDSRFEEINHNLRKIEAMHKETSLQLDEIDSYLQGDNDETLYINILIELTDIIEDFYHYASSDKDSPLFEQAQMMWNAAKNKAENAGLTVIESAEEPFDFNIHSIEGTSFDENLPDGYVIKTLKCGFVFKDTVIRHAAVIVNKQDTQKLEADKQEVIYL